MNCRHCGVEIELRKDSKDEWVSFRGAIDMSYAMSYCAQPGESGEWPVGVSWLQEHEPLIPLEQVVAELQMIVADLS